MVDVPGAQALSSQDGVLYLVPSQGAASPGSATGTAWPPCFRDGIVLSLTGFNPRGKDAPEDANLAANVELHLELKQLQPPPTALWRSFEFHPVEGWREEGFSVAYADENADAGRRRILQLARQYEQAAIYSYRVNGGALVRTVEWCDPSSTEPNSFDRMSLCLSPPATPLAARPL